jgi:hypothetical protein
MELLRMFKDLLKEIVLKGLVRHGTQALGGALVGTGIGTGSDAEVIFGLALNASAFGWSALRKVRRARKERKEAPYWNGLEGS